MNLFVPLRLPIPLVRRSLALLRLFLLYALFCALLLAAGLLRASLEVREWQPDNFVADTPAAALPFAGVNVDLGSLPAAQRQAALHDLRHAGFGWVRQRFDWGLLEPQPGVYDWATADRWLAEIVAAGLEPLAVLDGSPAWARAPQDRPPADNPLAPPADPASMARFAAAFAARYASLLRFYQVWDEPNIAPHWGNRLVEPVAYAQLLKAVTPAIRAADPDAVVAAAALAPTADRGHTAIDEVYFLQRMVSAGAANYFDAVAIQPFGFGYAPSSQRQEHAMLDFQRAALIRRALQQMGLGDKPVWAVRFGWNRLPNRIWGAVTAQAQASYAAAALDIAWRQWPWLTALGWAADDAPYAVGDARSGFDLYMEDGAPAPVFATLQSWLAAPRPLRVNALSDPTAWRTWLPPWLLLAVGLAVVVWRIAAAGRLLPWAQWIVGWRRLPWPLQAAGWGGLLLLYYLAVWPPLIGFCWLLWALLCLAQPCVGLGVAAALLPFYFQHKELHLVTAVLAVPPAAAALACLLPAAILHAWRSRPRLLLIDWTLLALLAISLLATAQVWQWPAFFQGVIDLVLIPLGLYSTLRILDQPPPGGVGDTAHAYAVVGLLVGGTLAALWGLLAWLGGYGVEVDGVRRLLGPHFSPNHTALYLLRTFFLGIGLALSRHEQVGRGQTSYGFLLRWVLYSACAFVLVALVLTGSRGALLLGLPVGGVVLGWAAWRRWPQRLRRLARRPILPILPAAAALLVTVAVFLLWDRLFNLTTLGLRLELWVAALRLWRDHLLLGVGPGGFFWNYPAYLLPATAAALVSEPNQLHPHNLWLEVATTWGLLGLAWLALLLWQVGGSVRRRWAQPGGPDWLVAGLVAALLAAAAHAQVDSFFLLPDLAGWNALALALLLSHVARPDAHQTSRYSAG